MLVRCGHKLVQGDVAAPRKSAQDDKWNFCLTTAIIAANGRDHEQTITPEPHTGLQGQVAPNWPNISTSTPIR